jgi:D-allose transport system substrate-binding protein
MMALGAVEAVHNANKSSSIKIIGVDGTADARKAVAEGHLTATVAQLPYLMGERATELAIAAVHQQSLNQIEITPTPVLTSDYLKSKSDPLLQYIR